MDELREYIESIKSDFMFIEDNKIYLSPAMFNLSINEIINVVVARGLMQITPIAVKEVNRLYNRYFIFDDMLNPEANVECGVLLFKHYLEYWKKNAIEPFALQLALLSYSWGITSTINWLKDTKPDNSFIDEAIPQEKQYYNESLTFWYMKTKAIIEELQKGERYDG